MRDDVNRSDNVEILGMGRCRNGHLFFELCVTVGRRSRERILSLEEFEAEPDRVIASLEAGLLTSASRVDFRRRVSQAARSMRPTFRVATRPSWFDKSFVLPSGRVIGGESGRLRVCLPAIYQKFGEKFAVRGSLLRWLRIPELAVGNSRLMLALALVCCGPVVALLKLEPPSVQLVGRAAGEGKSSILAGAGSFWGGLDDELGLFVEGWAQTKNNADDLAAAHGGTSLVLDDTRAFAKDTRAGFSDFCEAIMRMGEGRQKGRRDGSVSLRSRTPLLSASNDSLDDMARAVGAVVDDALRGRLVDVLLAAGIVGAFERLHGYGDHAELSAELLRVARENYGVASVYFLERLVRWRERDEAGVVAWLRARREAYLAWARKRFVSRSRDLTRFHHKFATLYAAGALAIELGVFPWDRRALARAILDCEASHVDLVAGVTPSGPRPRAAARNPLELLRDHVRARRGSFVDLRAGLVDRGGPHDHARCDGYVNRGRDGLEFLFSETRLQQVCGGKAAVLGLKRGLEAGGWLVRDTARPSTRRAIWADKTREMVVAVRAAAFPREGGATA